jgi:hypothetical protein
MVKVEMPRADWDQVLMCLRDLMNEGYILGSLYCDILDQVESQEG